MRRLSPLLLALALAACGSDNPIGPNDRTEFRFTDPTGDTLAFADGRDLDVRMVSGYVDDDSLIVTLDFTSDIARGSLAASNSLYGLIEIDADESGSTGFYPLTDNYRSVSGLGVEFAVILDYDANGGTHIVLYDIERDVELLVPARFEARRVTVRMPLSFMNSLDGSVAMVGFVENFAGATDVLPNTGYYTVRRAAGTGRVSAFSGVAPRLRGTTLPRWSRDALRRTSLNR